MYKAIVWLICRHFGLNEFQFYDVWAIVQNHYITDDVLDETIKAIRTVVG
jgi:hypothetical protein